MGCDTDIQLKTLSHMLEVFNMKIIMRRDSVILSPNNGIDSAESGVFLIKVFNQEIVSEKSRYP